MRVWKRVCALFFVLLTGCGGQGVSSAAADNASAIDVDAVPVTGAGSNSAPPTSPATNSPTNTSGPDSPTASEPLTLTSIEVPADGTTLSEPVRLVVHGTGFKNVELLPSLGYAFVAGRFTVSSDGTTAYLDFDPAAWFDGLMTARIVAFDVPPGQNGNSIGTTTYRWRLNTLPVPKRNGRTIPPDLLMPVVQLLPSDLPYVDPAPLATLLAMDDLALGNYLKSHPTAASELISRYIPHQIAIYDPDWVSPIMKQIYACPTVLDALACRIAFSYLNQFMQQTTH